MNSWKSKVWDNRDIGNNELTLDKLIKLNGFDGNVSSISIENWISMVSYHLRKLKLKDFSNLLEIGCGSGAFFYSFSQNYNINYYGYDYSQNLINYAIEFAKSRGISANFACSEAKKNPYKDMVFQYCYMHSVVHYFPSLDYFSEVIEVILKSLTPGSRIGIFNMLDQTKYDDYINSRIESNPNYLEDYKSLNHLAISPSWIIAMLKNLGFFKIKMYNPYFEGYNNSKYRFSIVAEFRG